MNEQPVLPSMAARQYRLLECIGSGGFSVVHRGIELASGQPVALKIVLPDYLQSERTLANLRRELVICQDLSHPNIVRVIDSFVEHDGACVVLEYLAAKSLDSYLGTERLTVEMSLYVMRQMASALEYLHSLGLVHRDVKPSNIVRCDDGRVVLTDFNLVGRAVSHSEQIVGSPMYMAPEILSGGAYGPVSDVYALGLVCWALLVGEEPFAAVDASTTGRPSLVPPSSRNKAVSPAFDELVRRTTAIDPDQRIPTMTALLEALTDLE